MPGGGMMPGYPGVGGSPYPGGAGGNVAPVAGTGELEALKDRITGEDTSRDKVVEVLFAIVLDPPPFGTAGTGDAPAGEAPVAPVAPVAPPAPASGPPEFTPAAIP